MVCEKLFAGLVARGALRAKSSQRSASRGVKESGAAPHDQAVAAEF